jgi:ribosomal protein S18 acetylase RimI-like enzyme
MPIRRASVDDARAVVDVFIAARAGMSYLRKLHTDEDVHEFFRTVVLEHHEAWVSEDAGGRIVGFATLGDATLEHLYVHPSSQGRGIGAELLAFAKARRPSGFSLWVFQRNDGARRFYERHGCSLVRLTDGAGNEEGEPDALYAWRPPR